MPKPKKHFPPTETPIIVAVKKLLAQAAENVEKRLNDVTDYLTGALEQLMFQQAQHMSVQAAILEYLNEHLSPGSEATIRGIMEANIAKAKAEREAREKQLAEEAEKRKAAAEAEAAKLSEIGGPETGEEDRPPAFPGAPSPESDHGSEPGRITPVESPADIVPETPADAAPAESPGSA